MLLQDFLRNGGKPEDLAEKLAIKATRHGKHSNLVLFKYNQIESPMSDSIVCECRGIILDETNNWEVVSRPFDKFFNYGEGHAAEIDWKTVKVQEKVDGSLATIYPYNGQWHIATSGTPDASGEVNGFCMTFAELFWDTFKGKMFGHHPEALALLLPPPDCGYCFMFELTTPYNKVVVRHKDSKVILLGARNLKTQKELSTKEAADLWMYYCHHGRETVKEFPLTTIEEIFATFDHMDPTCQEGYVVVDANFNRVKVKSPAYVALHHMKDGLSSIRSLVQVVLNGEIDEVSNALPEYANDLKNIKLKLNDLISSLETDYDKIKEIKIQKEFALEALQTRCSSALFSIRAGKATSVKEFLKNMNIDSVVQLLGLKVSHPATE